MAESSDLRNLRKPSETYDTYWISQHAPADCNQEQTLGKWLVFKDVQLIDETWEVIRKRVESGELGATGAKVSTMQENPHSQEQKVICVYTTEADMDEVGLRLIQLVKETIRYKKDQTTREGKYYGMGYGKVTCRTLWWNRGSPQFE